MNGLPASNISHVVVVHTGGSSVVAGVIGGAVVLVGVVLTEALVRHRERRRRLEEATWTLLSGTQAGLMTGNIGRIPPEQLLDSYARFVEQLGRIRADAKWPMRNAEKIRAEVGEILVRFMVAMGLWGAGKAGPPRLGPIIGDDLSQLVFGGSGNASRINDSLREAGLPTVNDLTADTSHNMPLTKPET